MDLDLLESSYGQVTGSLARFKVTTMRGRSPLSSRKSSDYYKADTAWAIDLPPSRVSLARILVGSHRPRFHTETTAVLPDSGPSVSN